MIERGDGNLPVLNVSGRSIPEAWENSVVKLYGEGLLWSREGPKDQSRQNLDSTMTIEIKNPDFYLFMHKYMTCAPEDLFEYQLELLGAKDAWVHKGKGSTKWEYHYHERAEDYPGVTGPVNQIQRVIDGLANQRWQRRHNISIWVPERDFDARDPPCLQRLWYDLVPDETTEINGIPSEWVLNVNYNFRTRNVMIAAPMNMVGLNTLSSHIMREVAKKSGMRIRKGRMVDIVDSYHVSAQDYHILLGFMERLKASEERGETPEDRCFTREQALASIDKEAIKQKILYQTKKELEEKGEFTDSRFETEREKLEKICQEVSEINGY